MTEWIVIGLVLSVVSGVASVPYLLLYRPHRVKRLSYFLMARWPWYRSWVWRQSMRRMTKATIKVTASIAGFVEPMKRMARAFEDFHAAMVKADSPE